MKAKTKVKAILRIVKAPHTWYCAVVLPLGGVCGKKIEAGEECGKMGKKIICAECLKKEASNGNTTNQGRDFGQDGRRR